MIPKIAFLFLTVGNIFHESTWIKYFQGNEAFYSLYIHPKNELGASSFFASSIINERFPSSWSNTMEAQVSLLREALKDTGNEKFVFLSESTIPLSTFAYAYERLFRHPYSELPYVKNPFPERIFGGLQNIYINPQWVVLNRSHAQLMVEDKIYLEIFARYPHDQEHYPSTFLAHHNLLEEVVNSPTTLVIWERAGDGHPHLFEDLATDSYFVKLIESIQGKELLFARKFSKSCQLEILHSQIPQLY